MSLAGHRGLADARSGKADAADASAALVAAAEARFARLDALHLQNARLGRDLAPIVAALAKADALRVRVLNVSDNAHNDEQVKRHIVLTTTEFHVVTHTVRDKDSDSDYDDGPPAPLLFGRQRRWQCR